MEQHSRKLAIQDLVVFAKSYLADRRGKLVAVLVLEGLLTSLNGVGLLLIVPLLGLLGIGGSTDNAIWRWLSAGLGRLGISLTLASGLALFVAIIGLHAVLNWRRTTWKSEVEQRFQASLRNRLYAALARTELVFLQRLRTSEFVQSTQNEIRRAQQAADTVLQLFSQALNLLAFFVVAMVLSFQLTLVAIACGAAGAVTILRLARRTHALSLEEMRIRGHMVNNLLEHIQGLRVARSLGLTSRFAQDYRTLSNRAADINIRVIQLSAKSFLAFELVAVLVLAAIVHIGLTVLELDAARFLVLLLIFVRLFPAVGKFNSQVQLFVSLLPAFRHYRELLWELERHEEVAAPLNDVGRLHMTQGLELRHVSFRYHADDPWALRDVSFTITRGSMTALAGHSGAGKSTLVDVVTGLLPLEKGDLCLDERALSGEERIQWRKETAVVPQESFLFNDSIRGNLLCTKPDASDDELWAVLDAVNSRGFVESKRDRLDTEVGERGARLSGGERQRISIARALLRSPQLLVLDEPTNNLDNESVQALLDILERVKRQATLLIVSHDPRILRRADRVFTLEDGTVLAGAPAAHIR